ncbi:glycine-rich protein (plasmid) [Aneurinibacillus sp. Ricciae_BoGa-3]|uniref:glycine rich domain-containing protein n=1 Tax=Aneurinibacillus sp. Ricciae_BoGa-3 TaxID=3022697 RepID=UPI0023414F5F|nr:glycine-rich protein [Aneurinibacillus sp. Ricciae_BoGa-3]WCK57672.1 glycine-rich protein [Aneurinibacillus sp. Ricciae_BoGa-3]
MKLKRKQLALKIIKKYSLSSVLVITLFLGIKPIESHALEKSWDFSNSQAYTFTAPYTGAYQLEVWGAQGAGNYLGNGGRGGYASGSIKLTAGQNLLVRIGSTANNYGAGFNGGGRGGTGYGSDFAGFGGGGATDISDSGTRLIVAGGGGGGNGGGDGGSLFSGGMSGSQGGDGGDEIEHWGYGGNGGGGGYYGGSGTEGAWGDYPSGARGGTSYIGGVQNGQMISSQAMSSPSGSVEYGHLGNGYARITFLNASPVVTISSPSSNGQYNLRSNMTLSGTINDPDTRGTMYVKYAIDNGSTVTVSSLTDTSYNQNFYTNILIANNLSIGNHTLSVWGEDSEGGVEAKHNIPFTVRHNIAPILTLSQNISSWTNQVITLTASTINNEEIKRIQLPDGNWISGGSATYTISANGTYSFVAEDNESNQTTKSIIVSNIDTSAPTTPTISNNETWTSQASVPVTIGSGSDIQSGVNHTEYKLDGATNQGYVTYSQPFSVTNEGETKITARTVDNVGNVSSEAVSYVRIDRSTPTNTSITIQLKP